MRHEVRMKDEGGRMNEERVQDLRTRTKQFALAVIQLVAAIPKSPVGLVIGRQLLRSGTSVGAHYREAYRARSNAEFISKIETGLQELDESGYWIEHLIESRTLDSDETRQLAEIDELLRIFVTVVRKAKEQ